MIELKLREFRLRLVNENDALFIVELRTNKDLSKYLNPIDHDIELQKKWIRDYKEREEQKKEFYFIAETYSGEGLGLIRLYNFKQDSFESGSWIFKKNDNEWIPIKADLAVRDFAYEQLGLKKCEFEVRKDNKNVVRYHKLFNPKLKYEDELNFYYELDFETYKENKVKIFKMISHG